MPPGSSRRSLTVRSYPALNKAHLRILALSLTAVGLSLFLYKALVLHFPLTPQSEADIWEVEAKIIFQARNEPVKLSLFIPYKNPRYDHLE